MKEKIKNADETGGIAANDIREFMMATDKLKADETLRSKHNHARLVHSYDLGSDAENLSDHDNGWGFRRACDHERTIANGFSRTRKSNTAGSANRGNGGATSSTLIPPSSGSDNGTPGRSQSRRRKGGKKNEAEVEEAEEAQMSPETRKANNARHRTVRMKTPKYTCAFMPGCNNTVNHSKWPEGQACICYRPIDPPCHLRTGGLQLLIDVITNQALHDKAQKIFSSGKGRKVVIEYQEECRTMWLANKQGTAAAEEGEAAQEHSTGASSAGSAAEEHGLGISGSSASEEMLEISTDSDSDWCDDHWRNDTDTTDSDSEATQALSPQSLLSLLLAPDVLHPEHTFGSGQGALIAVATPENDALHRLTAAEISTTARPATSTWPKEQPSMQRTQERGAVDTTLP
jgi:hypothetical protein